MTGAKPPVRRVLHVVNGELYSGAERVQDLLALRLPECGYEVGFACIKPGLFPDRRSATQAPLYRVPMHSRFDLRCGLKVAAIVREGGYALVHTHTPRSAMVGRVASLMAGVPMVHHVHSPTARDTESAGRNRVNRLTERASLLGVRRLIAVSRSLSTYLRDEGFDQNIVRVVPNGVPTPGPLRERPAPAPPWTVGTVALFRPRKGLEVLLQALALLHRQGRLFRLLAVGPFETADYEASIHALARQLGIEALIEWVGFTADVNSQFARMDAFVLPSLYGEGMPMVVLEAMANGVPVVATRVEGIPEVIEDGRTGWVVPPSDAPRIAEALTSLLGDQTLWQTTRQQAFYRQESHFSDSSMAMGVAAAYEEILRDG